ncbi:MAG: ATP synthase subunit C [Candidatus Jordarchaeum sp.]|uniref:ATP synthase subunit C n=1 Tax=Candidatus Jordarchaeum sp. TaxID=2823881 RepID=UPI00404A1834
MNKKFLLLYLAMVFVAIAAIYNTFIVVSQVPSPLSIPEMAKTTVGAGVGLAIGLAGAGAGIGMGTASAAAIGAISEKPEMFGRTIIYIVLIEAIAIYGLVISFLLLPYLA